jgi:hypothetical protein
LEIEFCLAGIPCNRWHPIEPFELEPAEKKKRRMPPTKWLLNISSAEWQFELQP